MIEVGRGFRDPFEPLDTTPARRSGRCSVSRAPRGRGRRRGSPGPSVGHRARRRRARPGRGPRRARCDGRRGEHREAPEERRGRDVRPRRRRRRPLHGPFRRAGLPPRARTPAAPGRCRRRSLLRAARSRDARGRPPGDDGRAPRRVDRTGGCARRRAARRARGAGRSRGRASTGCASRRDRRPRRRAPLRFPSARRWRPPRDSALRARPRCRGPRSTSAGSAGDRLHWGASGAYARLAALSGEKTGDASRVALDLVSGPMGSTQNIRVSTRQQIVSDEADGARFAAHSLDWNGAVSERSQASVSARLISQSRLLSAGPAADLFARESNAVDVAARYQTELSSSTFARLSVSYRERDERVRRPDVALRPGDAGGRRRGCPPRSTSSSSRRAGRATRRSTPAASRPSSRSRSRRATAGRSTGSRRAASNGVSTATCPCRARQARTRPISRAVRARCTRPA